LTTALATAFLDDTVNSFLGDSANVSSVKDAYLSSCPNATLGQMADAFMANPSWSDFTSTSGGTVVELTGGITFDSADVDALIQPLHEAWQFLHGHESTSLVGFSFGGMTAALWMAAYPEDANHLVLVGAPGLGVNSPHRIPLKGWRHLPTLEMQEKAHEHNLLSLMLHEAKNLNDLAMAVHVGNVTRDRMTRRRLSTTTIVLDNLPHIACPVHVIYGEFDAMYQERMPEVEAVFKKAIPQLGSWQLIPDAGHWVQFESPERFQHALHLTLKAM
jgi:pimeloyl-ACP methyl ester carboxylesterase